MNFLQPVFLWALAGAGLPVLLHFLARKKAKPFPFSTLRFLKISQLTTGRLRKLEEFLILLLRVLVMMLLVLVLAGPVSRRAIGFLQEQLVVLVLDDSYSLRAGEPASPWQQTRQAALTVLASLRKPARVALIFTSGRTTGLTRNLEEVGQTIRDSQATFSSGHLQTALEQAQKILARRTGSRILFVFSDLQRYAWKDLSLPEAGREGISVVVVDTGQKETNNVGLKGLTLLPAQGLCQAEVVNWNQSPVTVEIQLQAGQVEKKSLTLPARESQTVQFKLSRSPGTLRVQLIRPDLLPEDNTYVLHLAPGENNRFLLVTGKQESSFYLETALAAFTAPAQLQVVSVDSLTRISLSDYQMVFLCNTGRWQPEAVRSLADYLREGGQLIVFAGEKDLPENFNSDWELREEKTFLMPARLEELVTFSRPAGVIWGENRHPFFAPFGDRLLEYLKTVTFHQVFRSTVLDGNVLLKLDRGLPLLLEGHYGAGSIILCPFLPDPAWTNLPRRPFFPVLVEIMMQTLTSGASPVVFPGQAIQAPAGTESLQAVSPDGLAETVSASGGAPIKFFPEKPGIWQFSFFRQGTTRTRTVAVNLDWREGDLTRQEPASLRECFPGARVKLIQAGNLERYLTGEVTSGDLSPVMLALLLILFLLQVAASNFLHQKKDRQEPLVSSFHGGSQ